MHTVARDKASGPAGLGPGTAGPYSLNPAAPPDPGFLDYRSAPLTRSESPLHDERCSAPRRFDSSLRLIDIKTLSRLGEALGYIAVCFSCDELINSIGLSELHPTIRVPARPEPEGP